MARHEVIPDSIAIPALVGTTLAGMGGAGYGTAIAAAASGTSIGTTVLAGLAGGLVGGSAALTAAMFAGAAAERYLGARRQRIAQRGGLLRMPIATSAPTPVQPRGRSRTVVIPAQPTRPPSPPPPPPHLAAARVYNQRAMPLMRGFQPMVVRSKTSRRGARV